MISLLLKGLKRASQPANYQIINMTNKSISKALLKPKIFLVSLLIVLGFPASAQFEVGINKTTGAINQINNPKDKYQMNWIFASGDPNLTWQKPEQDWGLGKYDVIDKEVKNERWVNIAEQKTSGKKTSILYKTKYMNVRVDREPVGTDYVETYTFINTTGKKLSISGLDIYTPFNDNYPDAKIAATNRCNAHVWPGMNSSYVNAIRMNGEESHLGLIFTKGAMQSYSIANRDTHKNVPQGYTSSNVRGVITLNIENFVLQANGVYTVQWKLFWHKGWDDFYKKAIANGFVKLDADSYVIKKNQKLKISVNASPSAGIKNETIIVDGKTLGEHSEKVYYDNGKKYTMLNYLVISSAENLIDKRVHFIVDNQQMNDPKDGRNGAYMLYDNELKQIYKNPAVGGKGDRDEGRERLGMGVLIAKWLQKNKDEKVYNSLLRYVKFVREVLQTPDYKVYSNVDHTSKHRSYNYPWVAHLYLEMYNLTKKKEYLEDFYGTMRKYYQEWGYKHYVIGLRVTDALAALQEAGMKEERETLMNDYIKTAESFVETGIFYPKHEVNYEQSIVAPGVVFLCEMYQLTKDKKYLDGAKLQLRSLEAFNGRQPDVHLNEIAIRHWDGYWFGKPKLWGDTMPHYWSVLTADAFQRYYECTGDESYKLRSRKILDNNLLNFKEDGTASCAYLYPAYINDEHGKFYDPFANDQDWALVYYLDIITDKKQL